MLIVSLSILDTLQLDQKSESFLMELLRVSSSCNLTELKHLTEQSLAPFVDTSNVIRMYQLAVQSSAEALKQHCSSVMFSHWDNFSHDDFEPLGKHATTGFAQVACVTKKHFISSHIVR